MPQRLRVASWAPPSGRAGGWDPPYPFTQAQAVPVADEPMTREPKTETGLRRYATAGSDTFG
jgi:hypothetical protein